MNAPTPTWHPIHTPTTWWRLAPRRDRHEDEPGPPQEETDTAGVLADWLLQAGGRHRLELRLGTSGRSAGAWLGLSSVGATPADAEATGRRGVAELGGALRAFGWSASRRSRAPSLPPALAGLHAQARAPFSTHLGHTRDVLRRLESGRAPLVLVVHLDPTPCPGALVREASAARLQARVQAWRDIARNTSRLDREAHATRIREIEALRNALATVRVRMGLHGRQHPGPLALRLLSTATSEDLASIAMWGPTPAPPFEAGFDLTLELLELTSQQNSVTLSRQGAIDPAGDELPPLE